VPEKSKPSSGTPFHSLHATSQALQPMHSDVSVKNPSLGWSVVHPASVAGSPGGGRAIMAPHR